MLNRVLYFITVLFTILHTVPYDAFYTGRVSPLSSRYLLYIGRGSSPSVPVLIIYWMGIRLACLLRNEDPRRPALSVCMGGGGWGGGVDNLPEQLTTVDNLTITVDEKPTQK